MKRVNCRACRVEIETAVPNEPSSAQVRAHVEACSPCQEFRDGRTALYRLVGSLETVPAPPDFDLRLRARLGAKRSVHTWRSAFGNFPPRTAAAVASASLAVLIAAAVFYGPINPPNPNFAETAPDVASVLPAGEVRQLPEQSPSVASDMPGHASGISVSNNAPQGAASGANQNVARRNGLYRAKGANANRRVNPLGSDVDGVVEPSLRDAPVIKLIDYNAANNSPGIITVRASTQLVKVSLDGAGNEARTVSLKSFAFGSQELVERQGNVPALASTTNGVW